MKIPIRYFLCFVVVLVGMLSLPNGVVQSFAKEFTFQWTANHTNDEVDFYRIYWSRNYGEYDDPAITDPPPRIEVVDDAGGEGVKYGTVYDQVVVYTTDDIQEIAENGIDGIACFAATAVDLNGYESDYSDQFCHGPVIPPFVITEANQSSYTLSGWAYPGENIYIYPEGASGNDYINEEVIIAGPDGSWTATGLDFSGLPEGEVTLYVKSNNTNGPYATGIKDSATSKFTAGPGASGITETSAVIAWSTNENTRTVLEYRTADQSLPPEEQISEQLGDGILKVDHSMQINSLTPSRAYYYRVRATDASGNELTSNERIFWTLEPDEDNIDPIVTQPSDDGNPSETGATISWYVNEWCTSDLECRIDDGTSPYISRKIDEGEGDRTVDIYGLAPGETYICRVRATDASGNGPVVSQESDPFTTRIDNKDPVIDESTINVTVDYRSATITWETDENATSVVEYWTAGSAVQSEPPEPVNAYDQNHLVILVALNDRTTYNFRVISTDDAAVPNTAYSSVQSFTTLATPDETDPVFNELPTVNVTDNTATISWVSNEETTGSVKYVQTELGNPPPQMDWEVYPYSKDDIVLKTVHSVILTGLDKGKLYYYRVGITDGSENGPILSNEYGFLIEADVDSTAPQFDQWPTIINITSNSAVIQWSTDEDSTSMVRYGLEAEGPYYWDETRMPVSDYTELINDAVLTRDHLATLTNLVDGEKYLVMVGSTDIWGNGPMRSTELSFTTDAVPDTERPRITEPPTVTGITSTSATIYWETDEPANGEVRYGRDASLTWTNYEDVVINNQTGTTHTVILNNLDPSVDNSNLSNYYFRVGSTDAAGNGPNTDLSETNNPFSKVGFTTLELKDETAPSIIGGPRVAVVDVNSTIITWETDEPSNSLVQYGISSGTLNLSASNGGMVTEHSVTLTGLNPVGIDPPITYNYHVASLDGSGNGPTVSAVNSFTTPTVPDEEAPNISNVDMIKQTDSTLLITWTTNEPANSLVQYIASDTITWGDDNNLAESDAGMHTSHSVTITNLASDTLYAFRVASIDAKGNGPGPPYPPDMEPGVQNFSDIVTFRTDIKPDFMAPQIELINGEELQIEEGDPTAEGKRTVVITWKTDEPSNSQVHYDIKELTAWNSYAYAENDTEFVEFHKVIVTNLEEIEDTVDCPTDPCIFYFRVSSTDASGNDHETNHKSCPPEGDIEDCVDGTDANPSKEKPFRLEEETPPPGGSNAGTTIQAELEEFATCYIHSARDDVPIVKRVLVLFGALFGVCSLWAVARLRRNRNL